MLFCGGLLVVVVLFLLVVPGQVSRVAPRREVSVAVLLAGAPAEATRITFHSVHAREKLGTVKRCSCLPVRLDVDPALFVLVAVIAPGLWFCGSGLLLLRL